MQNNITIRTHNRPGQKNGGGIAPIHKKSLNIKQLEHRNSPTIEYAVWKTIVSNTSLHLMGLYHPPLANGITMAIFLDEVTDLQNLYPNTTT